MWVNTRLKVIEELVKVNNCRMLDLGCGPGYLGMFFAGENYVVSADINEEELRGIPKTEKVRVDARNLPFEKKAFDYVICGDAVEHIDQDKKVLSSIHEVLKDSGTAIVTVPAFEFLFGAHDKFRGHYRRYSKDKFKEIAQSAGFRVEYVRYVNSLAFPVYLLYQKFSKSTKMYEGTSKIERRIVPLLDIICEIDKRLNLPLGTGLVFVLKKNYSHKDAMARK